MKTIIPLLLFASVVSCRTAKNAPVSDDPSIQKGMVYISKECGVIITITENDQELKLYPVNLEDQFKKDGLLITFNSYPSRAMQPAGCIVDRVVSVDKVKKGR